MVRCEPTSGPRGAGWPPVQPPGAGGCTVQYCRVYPVVWRMVRCEPTPGPGGAGWPPVQPPGAGGQELQEEAPEDSGQIHPQPWRGCLHQGVDVLKCQNRTKEIDMAGKNPEFYSKFKSEENFRTNAVFPKQLHFQKQFYVEN